MTSNDRDLLIALGLMLLMMVLAIASRQRWWPWL